MCSKIMNWITKGAVKRAVAKNDAKNKKHYEKIYQLQEERYNLEIENKDKIIRILEKERKKFAADKEHVQKVLKEYPEDMHDVTQFFHNVLQNTIIEMNQVVYQKLINPTEKTGNKLRITDQRLKKQKTNVKIFKANLKTTKKIQQIEKKEEKKKMAL